MSSFTRLEERTTIPFPRPVRIEELRRLFDVVAERVPCEFNYLTELLEKIGDYHRASGEPFPRECYVRSLNGTVMMKEGRATFTCERDTDYDAPSGPVTFFTMLRFLTTPGYDLEELSERYSDDLGLMDIVRQHITAYFAACPEPIQMGKDFRPHPEPPASPTNIGH